MAFKLPGWKSHLLRQTRCPYILFHPWCPDTPERWRAQLDHFNKHGVASRRFCVECSRASPLAARPGIRRTVSRSTTLKFESRRPKGHRRVVLIGHDLGGPHACTWHLAGRTAQSPIVINARRPLLAPDLVERKTDAQELVYRFIPAPLGFQLVHQENEARLVQQAYRAGGIKNPGYESPDRALS